MSPCKYPELNVNVDAEMDFNKLYLENDETEETL